MKILRRVLQELNIIGIDEKLEVFNEYRKKILGWNEQVNLTAIKEDIEFEKKHFVDSVLLAKEAPFIQSKKIIDVGTGAGFPGVPLAIISSEKEFVLVDSSKKKLKIVEEICKELKIENITTVHSRAEDLGRKKGFRESFDLCASRAVANMSTLCEYCVPLVKIQGYFVAYKGENNEKEIEESIKAITLLGGEIQEEKEPDLAKEIEGYELKHKFIYIKKIRRTPEAYPRKAGTPARDPIK